MYHIGDDHPTESFYGPFDNNAFGTYKDDYQNRVTDFTQRLVMARQRGVGRCYYQHHGCNRCGASKDSRIVFIRWYAGCGDHDAPDCRLHIYCPLCTHANSWDFIGVHRPGHLEPTLPHTRKKDFQKKHVYAWERTVIGPHIKGEQFRIPQEVCLDMVGTIFSHLRLPTPEVTFGPGKFSWMRWTTDMFLATPWGLQPGTIIHESAHGVNHWLEAEKLTPQTPGHGSLYASIYILMLEKYAKWDAKALWMSALDYRVKVEPLERTTELLDQLYHHNVLARRGVRPTKEPVPDWSTWSRWSAPNLLHTAQQYNGG